MAQALAIKYRPKVFDDVVEQASTKVILEQQLASGEVKHSYLFVGSAGTGKTTCARIFANEINKGRGNPIEIDAASHGNVSDIRDLVVQAKSKPLDADYKIFIIDECHCLSAAGWSAMLKLIEEPPVTAIFIFCTTDVQKVPKTIMSRCQRFDFKRISLNGIINRLQYICKNENTISDFEPDALEYVAKLADGGMRDAITYLDKVSSYSPDITLDNVVKSLGTVDYDIMKELTEYVLYNNKEGIIKVIEDIHNEGKDLKLFLKNYIQFLLDVVKWSLGCDWLYIQLPRLDVYKQWLKSLGEEDVDIISNVLNSLVKLQSDIKYSSSPKYDIEVTLLLI